MTRHIYISGPMRGIPAFNFPAFFKAEEAIENRYHDAVIFNPARRDVERNGLEHYLDLGDDGYAAGNLLQEADAEFDLRNALAEDAEFITRHCDMMIMLPGWMASKGATAERAMALALGIPVIEWQLGYEEPAEEFVQPSGLRLGEDITAFPNLVTGQYETRTTSSTGGQKGAKAEKFYQLPPEPLALLAEHFGKGAIKYAAHNFRKGFDWSLCFDALQRHIWAFWNGQDYDVCPADGKGCQIEHPETGLDTRVKTEHGWTCYNHTGSLHLVAAMWQAMVLVEFYLHHQKFDDRFIYGRDGEEHNGPRVEPELS